MFYYHWCFTYSRLYDLCVLLSLVFYVQSLVRSLCFTITGVLRTVACTTFVFYYHFCFAYSESLARSLCFTVTVVLRTVACTTFVGFLFVFKYLKKYFNYCCYCNFSLTVVVSLSRSYFLLSYCHCCCFT